MNKVAGREIRKNGVVLMNRGGKKRNKKRKKMIQLKKDAFK